MKFEYSVVDIGYTTDGNWLRCQQEMLSEMGQDGWELVSAVLLDTEIIGDDDHRIRSFNAYSMAMYFKREQSK